MNDDSLVIAHFEESLFTLKLDGVLLCVYPYIGINQMYDG
jgi:hypothetical protein